MAKHLSIELAHDRQCRNMLKKCCTVRWHGHLELKKNGRSPRTWRNCIEGSSEHLEQDPVATIVAKRVLHLLLASVCYCHIQRDIGEVKTWGHAGELELLPGGPSFLFSIFSFFIFISFFFFFHFFIFFIFICGLMARFPCGEEEEEGGRGGQVMATTLRLRSNAFMDVCGIWLYKDNHVG